MPPRIRTLVVEALAARRREIRAVFAGSENLVIAGEASSGDRAIELARSLAPDVVTIGHSRAVDAFDVAAGIMSQSAAPIIIMGPPMPGQSGHTRACEVGAVAFVEVPERDGPDLRMAIAEVLDLVHVMSEVKVVTRFPKGPGARSFDPPRVKFRGGEPVEVIAIGASTGGPQALQTVLAGLPADLPVPVLVVQHLALGFHGMLIKQLDDVSPLEVRAPTSGELMVAGRAYIGPDEKQMGVDRAGRIILSDAAPENGMRPAASFLFRSVANAFEGRSVGVLLTGMGRDGADELVRLHGIGALTIAQDEKSSVVYGMAKEAIAQGGASYVLSVEQIAPTIVQFIRSHRKNETNGSRK